MNKTLLFAALFLLTIGTVSAQKSNISKAKTKAFNVENPDPEGAKTAIEAALIHPETKDLAQTWFVAGTVYNKIQQDESDKESFGVKANADLRQICLLQVLPSFLKADSLDNLPDEKGKIKPKYTKKIKNELLALYKGYSIPQAATKAFEKQDFNNAAKIFDIYIEIPKTNMLKDLNLIANDSNYTSFLYNAGIAHGLARTPENTQKAIKYFKILTESDYKDKNAVYQILLDLQLNNAKDTSDYVATLEEAVTKFPKEAYYIENLINYFVEKNQSDKAVVYLEKAIENDPTFPQYYFILGIVKERIQDNDGAEICFDKTIALQPDHAEAIMGKGRIIYNRGVIANNEANDIKDNKEYKLAKEKVNKIFKEALPYFEKGYELKPNDIDNLRTLRGLYYTLDKTSEYEKIDNVIKDLGY